MVMYFKIISLIKKVYVFCMPFFIFGWRILVLIARTRDVPWPLRRRTSRYEIYFYGALLNQGL